MTGRSLGSPEAWDFLPTWTVDLSYDTVDFSSILETHLARAGWNSGQALIVHIVDDGSSSGHFRQAKAREESTTLCAELRVTYS